VGMRSSHKTPHTGWTRRTCVRTIWRGVWSMGTTHTQKP